MAKLVTLDQLRDDLDERANIENDQQFPSDEKLRLINQALTKLYDELVQLAPPDYYLTRTSFMTTAGQSAYPLPADFYKIRRVQVSESSDRRRSLNVMQPDDRVVLQTPTDAQQVFLEYIPTCPELASPGDTFDGVNGWEELVTLEAAIKVYRKKGLDPSTLQAELKDERERVGRMAYRDAGAPPTMTRTRLRGIGWPWTTNALTHYRLVGDELEIWRLNSLAPYP